MDYFKTFTKKHAVRLIFLVLILWVLIFSLFYLTTKPKFWLDEGVNVELARNFSWSGKLDVIVKPDIFSGYQPLLQATGYPVTVLLALFFKIFGFGLVQARLFMLIWIVLLLFIVFHLFKKIFDKEYYAVLSLLLIVTFAPFFANGRCVMGEIPGFLFLLLGLYFLWSRRYIFLSGIFFGLAVVAKPSIYLISIPAALVAMYLEKNRFWVRSFKLLAGLVGPAIIWVILAMPDPFSNAAWHQLINYYEKPFGQTSAFQYITQNIAIFWHHTTIIYFFILFAIIIVAIIKEKNLYQRYKNFFNFLIFYCFLSFIYFLKSPGWLRYLIAAQLLIFIALPPCLKAIVNKIKFLKSERTKVILLCGIISVLVALQLYNLFYSSDLFISSTPQKILEFIQKQPSNKTIGFINLPSVASLVSAERKFQTIEMMGLPILGENPLVVERNRLPDLIIADPREKLLGERQDVIRKYYLLSDSIGGYDIYSLVNQ